jgi:glycine cleavage system H protein
MVSPPNDDTTMSTLRGFHFPDSLLYHPKHMVWLRRETDGRVTLGLSALALATGGELLVFVARPLGMRVEAGRAVANVETAKTVSSVCSPIVGTLVEANPAVEANGELINRDPYTNWLVRIDPENWTRDAMTLVAGEAANRAHEEAMRLYDVESRE